MKYAKVYSILGIRSGHGFHRITAETTIRKGIPSFSISGMSYSASKESAERVRSAVNSSGMEFPYMSVHVNLYPADLRKSGASLDLPIAVSVLAATGKFPVPSCFLREDTVFFGELTISGEILPVGGLPAMIAKAAETGIKTVITRMPEDFSFMLPRKVRIISARSLSELLSAMNASATPSSVLAENPPETTESDYVSGRLQILNEYSHLSLTEETIAAVEIAAAGWHSMLMIGPPGTGKSSLAYLIHALLDDPDKEELSGMISAASLFPDSDMHAVKQRPFRSPHHSVSAAGLIGGGNPASPGEITRAHKGVLFLDEMAEFSPRILQGLREPMQNHTVSIVRFTESVSLPADFLFIAAANPCPCGYLGDPKRLCSCSMHQITRYRSRLAGPLRDRIDLEVRVENTDPQFASPFTASNLQRISLALKMQRDRYVNTNIRFNGRVSADHADRYLYLDPESADELKSIMKKRGLSYRKLLSVRRMARTIADLAGSAFIRAEDVRKAAGFLELDDIWIH